MAMYVPAHFRMSDEQVHGYIASAQIADVVTVTDGVPEATFLPLQWVDDGTLWGRLRMHVARNNPIVRDYGRREPEEQALVIVRGPDEYVSPAGLPSHEDTGRVVPTWNYVAVHAYGPLLLHEDSVWLREHVTQLSGRFESGSSEQWRTDDAPGDFIEKMLRAVVGVEIPIERVVAKCKFAQNKTPSDVQMLLRRAESRGDEQCAAIYRDIALPAARARAQTLRSLRRG